tara:strand:- start:115 stop:288 length:174 start_codon:yes stop_codon:yes gene_type:complete
MDIDITVLSELPKVKLDTHKQEKSKDIKQVDFLDQLLSKKWLSDYFDPKKTTEKNIK